MSKLENLDFTDVMDLDPQELRRRQRRRGWALSLVGYIVYGVLRLFRQKPKDFYGVCPYFTIGKSWGGFELGWFFICGKNNGYGTQVHELGHLIQNAKIGGLRMLGLSIASAFRFWKRKIFGAKEPYDAWWFEGQATKLGSDYIDNLKRKIYLQEKEKENGKG